MSNEKKLSEYEIRQGVMDAVNFLKRNPKEFESLYKFHKCSLTLSDLVESKQAAYGDSFGKSGQIVKILYPDGIKDHQLDDALTIVRVIDKLFRIATKKDAFGESPWGDIMGYALLAKVRDERIKNDLEE